jgi:ketosteroid isomerase-like protein
MLKLVPKAALLAYLLMISSAGIAQDDEEVIRVKLENFLTNVSDAETHDSFWAEDLVYTSSSGSRFGKASIMEGFNDSEDTGSTVSPYSAEEVNVSIHGKTAILTFKLVNEDDDTRQEYYNSGTLIKRKGDWKVVCWQATKIPAK